MRAPHAAVTRVGLSARDRRTLITGALTVGALVLLARGVPAWRAWHTDARDAATAAVTELQRAERDVRHAPATVALYRTRVDRYVALTPALIPGRTAPTAAATLGAMLSGAAQLAGLRVGAVQLETDSVTRARRDSATISTPGWALVRVRVRADAQGDVRGLTRFLAALERGPALLRVRELSVSQPEPAALGDRPEALRIAVVVEGLALIGSDSIPPDRRRPGRSVADHASPSVPQMTDSTLALSSAPRAVAAAGGAP